MRKWTKRHHNKIRRIDGTRTRELVSVETLDLSNNDITELRGHGFPAGLRVKDLYLSSNKISVLELGSLDHLGSTLQVLRLSRNRIGQIPVRAFQLAGLTQLELNRNRIRQIEGLTFQGLTNLEVLKLQRNNISKLTDGAFWDLAKMKILHLDYNRLTEVNSGSLYGLSSLQQLFLSNNSIAHINPDGWKFCLKLRELEMDHNDISGTIEDTNGAFSGLDSLNRLTLFGNKIKSVAKKAFSGLEALEHLNLGANTIRSIQLLQSDSFLCDCQLQWLPEWLSSRRLQEGVNASCAHPETLQGTGVLQVPTDSFVCDDLPKPQITVQPVTTATVLGSDVRLTCTAASSSSSLVTFAWRKDQELLHNADTENFSHAGNGVMEYTTILHLRHVTFAHEGRYQCIITNHFGSSYSLKARLTVNVLPSFLKIPSDSTIRTGHTARLECAAEGHPAPQIAWQKDGGTDFPAARERRMHVMPDDDVFFITDVKPGDMGVYSCTARNTAGVASANASLTVLETPHLAQQLEDRTVAVGDTVALQCRALGSPPPRVSWLLDERPLRASDRLHFTPGNRLLVIGAARPEDAGRYTCLMSNTLGTERAHSQLRVSRRRSHAHGGPCLVAGGDDVGAGGGVGPGAVTVGIVVIAVVTSIVATSLVWVCIIYQTRKKSEECSVTNTDETIVPPDVASYLSSQGTLSDRQDVCIRVDAGGFDGPVVCSDCLENGYSRAPEYPGHGFGSAASEEALCNGTPNGIRREAPGTTFPRNHTPPQQNHSDREGSLPGRTDGPTQEESYLHQHHQHHPPHHQHHHHHTGAGDPDCDSEPRQALLPNRHALRASQSESAPLRRASD
ncbi:hypothetical protein NHX12_030370 [Muraenolepis orangiensis]|uniref:Ig-like domain-containing protein n=1 Tax=Muraenolepis orangiensis TaxID=630683 RepID=A0A9Q0IMS8_9TELE|nr:hypothetical protein NHX12_030370 [Muraenolepis orangiensis]